MYLRHTTRVKDGKAHTYWRLVRSVRVGRKVVQQTVAQLGELDAEGRASMRLTESFAMLPAASVSGFYFAHPQACYFGVGRIGRDQAEDYARRRGVDLATAERWLSPILGYEPEGAPAGAARAASPGGRG